MQDMINEEREDNTK